MVSKLTDVKTDILRRFKNCHGKCLLFTTVNSKMVKNYREKYLKN